MGPGLTRVPRVVREEGGAAREAAFIIAYSPCPFICKSDELGARLQKTGRLAPEYVVDRCPPHPIVAFVGPFVPRSLWVGWFPPASFEIH